MRAGDVEEKLPRLLHFVWAGGEKIMPRDQREAVIGWAEANPSFKVCVWVDLQTTEIRTLLKYFRAGDANSFSAYRNIFLKDITTFAESQDGNFAVQDSDIDAGSLELAHPIVRYEINRFDPNYGSSSDLLRYLILSLFGGVYFDGDTYCGKKNLEALYESLQARAGDIFLIGEKSQSTNCPGNDAFVCSKGHPWMRAIVETVKSNYIITTSEIPISIVDRYSFDTEGGFVSTTLRKTGPEVILLFLNDQNEMGKTVGKPVFETCSSTVMPMTPVAEHRLSREFYQPFEANTREWVSAKIMQGLAEDQAIAIAMNTIRFEANRLGFMRFDDHVRHIIVATNNSIDIKTEPGEQENRIAQLLLHAIKNDASINSANIFYVQYFTRHAAFFEYYQTLPNLVRYKEQDAKDFADLFNEYQKPPTDDKKFIVPALLNAIKNNYFHQAVKSFQAENLDAKQPAALLALDPTRQQASVIPSAVVAPPAPKPSPKNSGKKCGMM